jgi:hypothetical protein
METIVMDATATFPQMNVAVVQTKSLVGKHTQKNITGPKQNKTKQKPAVLAASSILWPLNNTIVSSSFCPWFWCVMLAPRVRVPFMSASDIREGKIAKNEQNRSVREKGTDHE